MFIAVTCLLALHKPAAAQSPNPQSGAIGLSGKLPADPPKNPPTISVPNPGQIFTSNPINVSGFCESDLLIKVFKNGVFAGSAVCSGGSYTLKIDLFNGRNDLIARAYDGLDQSSPDSNTVSVSLNENDVSSDLVNRVIITSDFARRGANPNETLSWPFILSGGTGPYALSVDWGDGKTDLISRSAVGDFSLNHTYESPGIYRVVLKVSDANGSTAYLQVVAQINGATGKVDAATPTAKTIIRVVWLPAALAIPIAISTFWLGKRYEKRRMERLVESGRNPFER